MYYIFDKKSVFIILYTLCLVSDCLKMKFGLAASSVAGQTMQLVGAEDAFDVSIITIKRHCHKI